jgi:hypothetical protein
MATDVKEITVDSSSTEILANLTPAEHKAWRETGDIPERKPAEANKTEATETAESSTAAKTEVVEEKTESAPVKTESSKPAKGAEARIKELLADNKRLAAELDAARKPVTAPAKKTEEIAKPHRNDVDEKTGQPKYATDEEFLEARDAYVFEQASKKTRSDIAKEDGERRVAEQNRLQQQKWQNNLKIAVERHEDFAKVCQIDDKGAFQSPELKQIKSNGVLDGWLLDSDFGGLMLYYFASNKGEVARIDSMNAFAAARELTRIEEKLSGVVSTTASKQEEKLDDSTKPQVSKAPAPASSVGGRATAPVDEAEAALKRGDFRSYRETENKKEYLAKKKAS